MIATDPTGFESVLHSVSWPYFEDGQIEHANELQRIENAYSEYATDELYNRSVKREENDSNAWDEIVDAIDSHAELQHFDAVHLVVGMQLNHCCPRTGGNR